MEHSNSHGHFSSDPHPDPHVKSITSTSCFNKKFRKNVQLLVSSVIILILISSHVVAGLELKPATPEKEVFTGDSFVITCLSGDSATPDSRLQWLSPEGREVPSVPTAPIYVSEKIDGLQIVFLRHQKKHSGTYVCVQSRTETGEKLQEIPFTVKIYKSIEFHGPSSAIATEGEVFTVMCNAKFDHELASANVVWDKTGRNIVNENSDKYYVSETKAPNLKSTLNIRGVEKSDAGHYTCRATQFAPTISQFKQHDIHVRVQYKPKFPPSQTGGVWIDRQEILAGRTEMELNFTCAVDADPPAQVGWYDERGYQIRDPRDNIVLIDERPNNNVLRYRYRVDQTGSSGIMGGNMGSDGSWPPPGVNQYEKPARAQSVEQPNVQYECRAKNDLGSTSQMFKLRIGDLPPSPTLVSYTFEGNNLTLVLNQAASEPPVNHYKIELSDGVTVEFNSSSLVMTSGSQDHVNPWEPAQTSGAPSNTNATYLVSLDNVPSGKHRLVLYAHNGVGWSQAMRDPSLTIHVVNHGLMTRSSFISSTIISLILMVIMTKTNGWC